MRSLHPGSFRAICPQERSLSKRQDQVRTVYHVPGKSKEEVRQGSQQGEEKHTWAPTPSPEMGLRGLASWRSLVTLRALSVLVEACFAQRRWVGSNRRVVWPLEGRFYKGIREMRQVSQGAVGKLKGDCGEGSWQGWGDDTFMVGREKGGLASRRCQAIQEMMSPRT